MTVKNHPASETLLLDYAAGVLNEAEMLLIATHLAMVPHARQIAAEMEALAGAMLNTAAPAPVSRRCMEDVLKQLDQAQIQTAAPQPKTELPLPLCHYLDCDDFAHIRWTGLHKGIRYATVPLACGETETTLHLLEFAPGVAAPQHHHDALEMTLVLQGSYADEFGRFGAGDVSMVRDGQAHSPQADPESGCVCLVTDFTPRQINSLFGQVFHRFFHF